MSTDLPADRVREALADVDGLGGFFVIATGPAAEDDAGASWRPFRTSTGPQGPLPRRVDEVAAQIGDPTRRVAGSLLAMSVSARVTAVLLGAAVLHRVLPDLPHDRLHWRPWSGGPLPLWIADPGGRDLDALDDPVGALAAAVHDHLAPVLTTIDDDVAAGPQVLWGNVASSLHGAARVLVGERPGVAADAFDLVRALLERPPFAGLGELVAEPTHPTGVGFARRSCCLYHRIAPGAYCGDCVLR